MVTVCRYIVQYATTDTAWEVLEGGVSNEGDYRESSEQTQSRVENGSRTNSVCEGNSSEHYCSPA